MSSVWKHPKSQFWTACFTDDNGRQLKRSTKLTDSPYALGFGEIAIAIEGEQGHAAAALDGNAHGRCDGLLVGLGFHLDDLGRKRARCLAFCDV